jgi:orotate phosphoribosyltransferase-like protein/DNA-binding NarL/FixJ family response regulator
VWVSRDDLSLATSLPDIKVRVGLEQLETAGVIEILGDDGMRLLVRRGEWNATAAQVTADAVASRRRGRREQLDAMIAYAESNSCRRRILLDHFGDHSPAEASICCDNCMARQAAPAAAAGDEAAMPDGQRTTLVILDAVRRLKWGVGQEKLAQLLKGSRSQDMKKFGYDRSPYYARLEVFSQAEVSDLVGQAISLGYLKQLGGNRPVLSLTAQGEAAIKGRTARPVDLPRPVQKQVAAHKKAQREAGSTVALTMQMLAGGKTPPQIAAERMLAEDTIYNHLAQGIALGTVALEAVVSAGVVAGVRKAIAKVGNADRLAPLKIMLPATISYGEIRCVAEAWKREQGIAAKPASAPQSPKPGDEDPVAAFLSRPHPRALPGPWQEGWALGFHSGFGGADWKRSDVGDLTYRLKYESDASAVQPLVEQALALCRTHAALGDVDALVPVAPSVAHKLDTVATFTSALAAALQKPVLPALVKTRQTQPQKDMHSLAQKRSNVAGAFAVHGDVRGKRLLVLDDLFDSGATLEEATRVLLKAGATSVCVLTMTRTIHSDG